MRKPLLLKSPSNCYRLDFFRALFRNARITVVHVVRKPAPSMAGLMCGWRHHGFFKHLLQGDVLDIDGYTDPSQPWSCRWWKFDLPPGWRGCARRPLGEVCRYQWVTANRCLLEWLARRRPEIAYVQVRYERMRHDPRGEVLRLCRKIGVDIDAGLLQALRDSRHVMPSAGLSASTREAFRKTAEEQCASSQVVEMEHAIEDANVSYGP